MNFYDGHVGAYDVFIIFNEANDKTTRAEAIALQYMIKEELESLIKSKASKENAKNRLLGIVDNCGFNCTKYGVQVLIVSWFPEETDDQEE